MNFAGFPDRAITDTMLMTVLEPFVEELKSERGGPQANNSYFPLRCGNHYNHDSLCVLHGNKNSYTPQKAVSPKNETLTTPADKVDDSIYSSLEPMET